MDASSSQTAVIIVGGSLVGLCSAIFLRAKNVPVILIERHRGSALHPRAMGFTIRTLETFRQVDLERRMPKSTVKETGRPRRIKVESLSGKWNEEVAWTKPTNSGEGQQEKAKQQAEPPSKSSAGGPTNLFGETEYSPCQGSAVAQDALEPVLRSRALELGADIRMGWEMTQWKEDSDGVIITAVDRSGFNKIEIRGRYLIACDGSRSSIRHDLGIQMNGVGQLRTMRSILFRCSAINKFLDAGISQWMIQNDSMDGFLTTYRDGRWALMVFLKDGQSQLAWDIDTQRRMIRLAVGENLPLSDEEIDLITTGQWDLSAQVAEKFSQGSVFLAGDAAHTLPPTRGGYGANTGIADTHNLAWKIAAVLEGHAQPSLLETYNTERRPIALLRHEQTFLRDDYKQYLPAESPWRFSPFPIFDDIAMELGQIYRSDAILLDEADQALLADELEMGMIAKRPEIWRGCPGTRAPHLWLLGQDGERISTLDLFGSGWVVLSEDDAASNAIITESLAKLKVPLGVKCVRIGTTGSYRPESNSASLAGTFGIGHHGLVLVRPDGYIAWRAVETPTAKEFVEALLKVSHAVEV